MALTPTVLRLPALDRVLSWPDRARRLTSAGRQPVLDAVPADLADLRCPKDPSGCRVLRQTGSA
jgi:hypothetical protein